MEEATENRKLILQEVSSVWKCLDRTHDTWVCLVCHLQNPYYDWYDGKDNSLLIINRQDAINHEKQKMHQQWVRRWRAVIKDARGVELSDDAEELRGPKSYPTETSGGETMNTAGDEGAVPWYAENENEGSETNWETDSEGNDLRSTSGENQANIAGYLGTYDPSELTTQERDSLCLTFQIDLGKLSLKSILTTYTESCADKEHCTSHSVRRWLFDPAIWAYDYDSSIARFKCLACKDTEGGREPSAAALHETNRKHKTNLLVLIGSWQYQSTSLDNPRRFFIEMQKRVLHMSSLEFSHRATDPRAWICSEPHEESISDRYNRLLAEDQSKGQCLSDSISKPITWGCKSCYMSSKTLSKFQTCGHGASRKHRDNAPKDPEPSSRFPSGWADMQVVMEREKMIQEMQSSISGWEQEERTRKNALFVAPRVTESNPSDANTESHPPQVSLPQQNQNPGSSPGSRNGIATTPPTLSHSAEPGNAATSLVDEPHNQLNTSSDQNHDVPNQTGESSSKEQVANENVTHLESPLLNLYAKASNALSDAMDKTNIEARTNKSGKGSDHTSNKSLSMVQEAGNVIPSSVLSDPGVRLDLGGVPDVEPDSPEPNPEDSSSEDTGGNSLLKYPLLPDESSEPNVNEDEDDLDMKCDVSTATNDELDDLDDESDADVRSETSQAPKAVAQDEEADRNDITDQEDDDNPESLRASIGAEPVMAPVVGEGSRGASSPNLASSGSPERLMTVGILENTAPDSIQGTELSDSEYESDANVKRFRSLSFNHLIVDTDPEPELNPDGPQETEISDSGICRSVNSSENLALNEEGNKCIADTNPDASQNSRSHMSILSEQDIDPESPQGEETGSPEEILDGLESGNVVRRSQAAESSSGSQGPNQHEDYGPVAARSEMDLDITEANERTVLTPGKLAFDVSNYKRSLPDDDCHDIASEKPIKKRMKLIEPNERLIRGELFFAAMEGQSDNESVAEYFPYGVWRNF